MLGSAVATALSLSSVRAEAIEYSKRIVGYYASWTAREGFPPESVKAELLTDLIYAFANISEAGKVTLGDACLDAGECDRRSDRSQGNFIRLRSLKERNPKLRLLAGIGGWSWSKRFSDVALNRQTRERFIRSAIELFLDRWPGLFDGFDIDWEYPVEGGDRDNVNRPEDKSNFTALLAEFREQLNRRASEDRRRLILTAALPAAMTQNIELGKIHAYLDWLNLMTYDYHTGQAATGLNAPLFAVTGDPTPNLNVNATVTTYLQSGVPHEKLVMGIPFFGYHYRGVVPNGNGMFQRYDGSTYASFRKLQALAAGQYRRYWESSSKVPFFFDEPTRSWLTYDDKESVTAKIEYIHQHGLAGAMIWELSGDNEMLLQTIAQLLEFQ